MVDARAYDELDPALGAVHSLLLSVETVEGFLQELAELAASSMSPPISCGITVRYDHQPLTVASSDAQAAALDESQYHLDEGTCLHAMRSGEVVDVVDVERETRWPGYLGEARAWGLRSSLSLPILVDRASVGALNLYSFERARAFDDAAQAVARVLAARASAALLLVLRQVQSVETNRQLEEALTSRSVIDQALGIIMAQQRCAPEEAFAVLRASSQHRNRKLRWIAQEIVERVSDGSAD